MKIGKISENILVRSVLKNISFKGAAVGSDCAFIDTPARAAAIGYVADEKIIGQRPEIVVHEVASSWPMGTKLVLGNPIAHGIIRADNNMSVSGATTTSVTLSLSLPEKMREIRLKEYMQEAEKLCQALQIDIIGGHTETVREINRPIVTVNALGKKKEPFVEHRKPARPGDAIVMTKWPGLSCTLRLALENPQIIHNRFPSFYINELWELEQFLSIRKEAAIATGLGCNNMTDVGDGGIMNAVWKLSNRDKLGAVVDYGKILFLQSAIEVSNLFDINILNARSDGCLMLTTDRPEELLQEFEREKIPAAAIGKIESGIARRILIHEEEMFLNEPRQDDACRLCYND